MKTENFYRKTENFLVLAYIGLSPGNDMLFLYKIVFTLTLNSFEDDSDQIASKFSVISKRGKTSLFINLALRYCYAFLVRPV